MHLDVDVCTCKGEDVDISRPPEPKAGRPCRMVVQISLLITWPGYRGQLAIMRSFLWNAGHAEALNSNEIKPASCCTQWGLCLWPLSSQLFKCFKEHWSYFLLLLVYRSREKQTIFCWPKLPWQNNVYNWVRNGRSFKNVLPALQIFFLFRNICR